MTDERSVDRLMAHLRGQVLELRRLQRAGAEEGEIADRERLILRLQGHLAHAVSELLTGQRASPV